MDDLLNLLDRIRAAGGVDRELDYFIAIEAGIDWEHYPYPGVPEYTASVDAALALVERLLPGWTAQCLFAADGNTVLLYKPTVPFTDAPRGDSGVLSLPTPALAILAALLSALIAQAHPESPTEK